MQLRRPLLLVATFGASTLAFGTTLGGCADYTASPEAVSGAAGTGGSAGSASGAGGGSGSGSAGMSGAAGGGVAASCDSVQACGGDAVGTWTAVGACLKISGDLDLSGLGTDCKSAPILGGTLTVTGTLTVMADGTYMDGTTTTGEETVDLPQSCLTLSGTATTCKRIGGPLASVGYKKATCVDNAATLGCTCTAAIEQIGGLGVVSPTPASSGTYTVADNALSLSDGIHEIAYSYCVADTTLTVSPPSVSKTGASAGTILFSKQ